MRARTGGSDVRSRYDWGSRHREIEDLLQIWPYVRLVLSAFMRRARLSRVMGKARKHSFGLGSVAPLKPTTSTRLPATSSSRFRVTDPAAYTWSASLQQLPLPLVLVPAECADCLTCISPQAECSGGLVVADAPSWSWRTVCGRRASRRACSTAARVTHAGAAVLAIDSRMVSCAGVRSRTGIASGTSAFTQSRINPLSRLARSIAARA